MSRTDYKKLIFPIIEATIAETLKIVGTRNPAARAEIAVSELETALSTESGPETPMYVDTLAALDDFLVQLKDEIKEELRMEMFMEIQSVLDASTGPTLHTSVDLETFTRRIDTPPRAKRVAARWTDDEPKSAANSTAADENVDDPMLALQNNPLFMRVSRNIDRMERGEDAYSVEDMLAVRRDRVDENHPDNEETIRKFHEEYQKIANPVLDPESDDEVDQWNKLIKAKVGLN